MNERVPPDMCFLWVINLPHGVPKSNILLSYLLVNVKWNIWWHALVFVKL